MPELPEVETTCRGLAQSLLGKAVADVGVHAPRLRLPIPRQLKELRGAQLVKLTRQAKYIKAYFDNEMALLVHLGMSGRFLIEASAPGQKWPRREKHDHWRLDFGDVVLTYRDPRRFGFVDYVPACDLPAHPFLKHLAPDPLGDDFVPAEFLENLGRRRTSIKQALLDQKLIAGIGNIYACEALFLSRIDPSRLAQDLSLVEGKALIKAMKKVLQNAIKAGGTSLRDYQHVDGNLGYFQNEFTVYGRADENCVRRGCGGKVKKIVQGGRSTFYCSLCQS